jgi:hypothetical protein
LAALVGVEDFRGARAEKWHSVLNSHFDFLPQIFKKALP